MMTLDDETIERLASRKGVKRIAVENFLSTLDDLSYREAMSNLKLDASSYRWNAATVDAIREGIVETFKRTMTSRSIERRVVKK